MRAPLRQLRNGALGRRAASQLINATHHIRSGCWRARGEFDFPGFWSYLVSSETFHRLRTGGDCVCQSVSTQNESPRPIDTCRRGFYSLHQMMTPTASPFSKPRGARTSIVGMVALALAGCGVAMVETQRDSEPEPISSPPRQPPTRTPGGGGGPTIEPPATVPAPLYRVDFENAPIGALTRPRLEEDWPGLDWATRDLSRCEVVDTGHERGRVLRAHYPQGTFGSRNNACQWRVAFAQAYEVVYVAYRVRFAPGFDFVKGGKLPGLVGGAANTGGTPPDGTDGFSARMMWRRAGRAVQYLYHPDQQGTYGDDVPWGLDMPHHFEPGVWHQVEHRVRINTPGQFDGALQGWWDGTLAMERLSLRFRDVTTFAVDGFYFSTFFGGGDDSWAPPTDTFIEFDDFVIALNPMTH